MSRPDHEPLSPEERALADRLARLGPLDGPSSALDAKILAAAHAAVAPPSRRRRWLGLSALPGGLITGAGMAAALVVVVGVVWQLRPTDPAPRPAAGDGDIGYVSAQIIERPKAVVAPPPPPPVEASVAKALNPPAQRRAPSAVASAPAPTIREAAPSLDSAPTPAANVNATVGPDEYRRLDAGALADAPATAAYSEVAPAAAPAPAAMPAEAAVAQQQDAARQEAFGLAKARQQESSDDQAKAARSRAAATASAEPQPTLDRIEVTGSRITRETPPLSDAALKDLPVGADAELDAKAWLERIRARRDVGDMEGARDSFARFREAHPRVRVPRDLRALAKPPATR